MDWKATRLEVRKQDSLFQKPNDDIITDYTEVMAEEWQAEERLKKYLESKIDTSL